MAAPRTRSARERAQRPHLVPRDTSTVKLKANVAPSANADSDAQEIARRGWSDGEWKSPSPDVLLDAIPDEAEVQPLGQSDVPFLYQGEMMTRTPPAPQAVAAPTPAPAPALNLTIVSYADVDRLWDWARADAAGVHAFLGQVPPHGQAMYDTINAILAQEKAGEALLRSIYISGERGPVHIGFFALQPIVRASGIGMVRCYFTTSLREAQVKFIPILLDIVAAQEPSLSLTLVTGDYAFAQQVAAHGFTLNIALTRPPAQTRK